MQLSHIDCLPPLFASPISGSAIRNDQPRRGGTVVGAEPATACVDRRDRFGRGARETAEGDVARKSEPLEVIRGSGNAYRDLGQDDGDVRQFKALVCPENPSRTTGRYGRSRRIRPPIVRNGDAGLSPNKRVIVYARGGHPLTHTYTVLSLLDYKDVAFFSGVFDGWKSK
jgi:rhodanese-related sulfurtransferase